MKLPIRNILLSLIIVILISGRLYLESISFNDKTPNEVYRVLIVVICFILLFFYKAKLIWKFCLFFAYCSLLYAISLLGAWKIGAKDFISKNETSLDNIDSRLSFDSINSYLVRRPFDSILVKDRNGENFAIKKELKEDLISFNSQIGFFEIEIENGLKMIILSRFIDNGYGLIKLNTEQIEMLKKQRRINGYTIKGISDIKDGWYYIWFT
jgi:hypothetical protein